MKATSVKGDAEVRFLEQISQDLKQYEPFAPRLQEEISRSIGSLVVNEEFITEDMLKKVYAKATGKAIGTLESDSTYRRLRANVFFELLLDKLYFINPNKLVGDAATSLRLLATPHTMSPVRADFDGYFSKRLGGPVITVDPDPTMGRIYLKPAMTAWQNGHDAFHPDMGVAVLYHYDDRWELEFPGGEQLRLIGDPIGNIEKLEQLKKMQGLNEEQMAAINAKIASLAGFQALKDALQQYLSLPPGHGSLVWLHLSKDRKTRAAWDFARDALQAVDACLGQSSTWTAETKSVDLPTAAGSQLNDKTKNLVRSFRDGDLNFLNLNGLTDVQWQDEQKEKTTKVVEQLVGFLDSAALAKRMLDRFRATDDAARAEAMVNGPAILMHGGESPAGPEEFKREKISFKDLPAAIKKYANTHMEYQAFSGTSHGPLPAPGSRVEREHAYSVTVSGEHVGFVVLAARFDSDDRYTMDPNYDWNEKTNDKYGIAFDPAGKPIADRVFVKPAGA